MEPDPKLLEILVCPLTKGTLIYDREKQELISKLAGLPAPVPRQEKLDTRTITVLDCDGTQRMCLEAAARGESFVILGPAGTGKTKTIANLIADRNRSDDVPQAWPSRVRRTFPNSSSASPSLSIS